MRVLVALALVGASCGGAQAPLPPSAPTPTRIAAALFRANDVAAYEIRDAHGKAIGRAHSTFAKSPDGHWQVVTRTRVEPGNAVEHATTLRDDLSPVLYKRLSSSSGRYALEVRDAKIRVFAAEGAREVPAKKTNAPLVPENDLMVLALVLRDARLSPGDSAKIDVFDPDALTVSAWTVRAYLDSDKKLTVDLPGGVATVEPDGRIGRYVLHRDGRTFVPELPAKEPPKVEYQVPMEYRRPASARWVDRPVKIDVEGGTISGVLSMPDAGDRGPRGAAPCVVYLSEDGPHDRWGFMGRVDYGTWQLHDSLAEHGIAVLRVDDRGTGESKSALPAASRDERVEVSDAVALLRFAKQQPNIDGDRIVLVGHGRGGLIALAAALTERPTGLALLATPLPRASTRLPVGAALRDIESPVAVFQGLTDAETSWRDDAQPIANHLKRGKARNRFSQFFYDRVDHLMKTEPQVSSFDRYLDRSRPMDPKFLQDIVAWIEKLPR